MNSERAGGDQLVWAAREAALSSCLADRGFEYVAATYPRGDVSGTAYDSYPDEAEVAGHGYWVPAKGSGGVPAVSDQSDIDPETKDACNQEAARAVSDGDFADIVQRFDSANQSIFSSVLASAEFGDARLKWVRCMSTQGYSYETPDAARIDAESKVGDQTSPDQKAIAIAVADFGCQRANRLLETLHTLMADGVAAWLDENPDAMADLKAVLDRQAELATKVLDDLGIPLPGNS